MFNLTLYYINMLVPSHVAQLHPPLDKAVKHAQPKTTLYHSYCHNLFFNGHKLFKPCVHIHQAC